MPYNIPNRIAVASLMATALFCAGCGESGSVRNATVQGTVTIDGELATRGTVTFHPVDSGPIAVGQIQPDGSYSLSTGRGTVSGPDSGTVFPGTYQVTVQISGPPDKEVVVGEGGPPAAGRRLVALKYTSKETSGLEFEIKAGRNLCVLPVQSAIHDPPVEAEVVEAEASPDAEESENAEVGGEEGSDSEQPETEESETETPGETESPAEVEEEVSQ
ncbi:MAG: hypothetical protein KDA57_07365 [Planctomycetales bacterium]|nr:hypothetical protein [Planctomycetales bacterium]